MSDVGSEPSDPLSDAHLQWYLSEAVRNDHRFPKLTTLQTYHLRESASTEWHARLSTGQSRRRGAWDQSYARELGGAACTRMQQANVFAFYKTACTESKRKRQRLANRLSRPVLPASRLTDANLYILRVLRSMLTTSSLSAGPLFCYTCARGR